MTYRPVLTSAEVRAMDQESIFDVSHRFRDVHGHNPRLLDLYCGVGGATMGYQLAGFHVTGVDEARQNDYCGNEFYRGDAIEFLHAHGAGYDFIHASPPCQRYTTLTKGTNYGKQYPDLLPLTRDALIAAGRPYVIENVGSAPMQQHGMLCGEMFGLAVIRHRYFEFDDTTKYVVPTITHPSHRGRVAGWRHGEYFPGPYVAVYGDGGGKGSVREWQVAMEVYWTENRYSIAQSIPPKYTRYIGYHVMRSLV